MGDLFDRCSGVLCTIFCQPFSGLSECSLSITDGKLWEHSVYFSFLINLRLAVVKLQMSTVHLTVTFIDKDVPPHPQRRLSLCLQGMWVEAFFYLFIYFFLSTL